MHVCSGRNIRITHWLNANKNSMSSFAKIKQQIPLCSIAYTKALEDNIVHHCLIKKLYEVHTSNWTHEEKQRRVCLIDKGGKEYMKHTEKVCRKIKCCRIPYSPEASIWIGRSQVCYFLIKLHKGEIQNKGNLKLATRRCNKCYLINHLLFTTLSRQCFVILFR